MHHVYEQNEIKTRPIMVEKSPNLRHEIRTRRGDPLHLPYWARIYTVSLFCCSEPGGSKPFDGSESIAAAVELICDDCCADSKSNLGPR